MASATEVPAQNNQPGAAENDKSARERAQEHLKAARAELKKEQFAASRELLEKARQADPQVPGLDDLAKDIAAAEQKAEARKRDEAVRDQVRAADRLRRDKKFDEALVEVRKALELNPASSDAQKLRDRIDREKASAREKQLESAVKDRIKAAEAAVKQKNFDQARRLEAEARTASEGLFQRDLQRLADRIRSEESKHIAAQNRDRIRELLRTANVQMRADQFSAARQSVNQVLQIDKDNRDATRLLTRIRDAEVKYQADRQKREIEEELRAADRLMRADRHEEAVQAYQAVLQKDEGNRNARRGLERAQREIARAQPPEPSEQEQNEARARALASEGQEALNNDDLSMAEAKLQEAMQLAPRAREVRSLQSNVTRKRRAVASAETAQRQQQERERAEAAQAEQARQREAAVARREQAVAVANDTPPPAPETQPAPETRPAPQTRPAPVAEPPAEAAPVDTRAQERELQRQQQEEERAARDQSRERRRQAEAEHRRGLELYERGELVAARERWLEAQTIDPEFNPPAVYLENTQPEYEELRREQSARDAFARAEREAQERMNTLIPFRTLAPTTLPEFLQTLRLLSGIQFVIVGEVSARVEAAFEDEPLHRVLDSVLLPMGLRWRREPGSSTVIVEPDLRTEVFTVLPNELGTVNALVEQGVIPRLLYGPSGRPVIQGQEILVDPRRNILVVTDSERNIEKVRRILESQKQEGVRTQLVIESYEIDESRAPEIKALLQALLSADDKQPYNPERKLILEGSTLIVKDTSENIQRVRQILQDQNFLRRFYSGELTVATFNLTPVLEFEDSPDLVRAFTDQVRQVVETLLYAREGRTRAEREGRRLWFDPATLQLTITDTPDRLQTVQDYIESLPQIRSRRRSKIIFLDHAAASDLVAQIESFLGIESAGPATATGTEVVRTMRTGATDDFEFQNARFRVTRVNENDVADPNDDSVEILVTTGTSSQQLTVEQYRTEFVEDFQVTAEDIRPSSRPGEGRARLRIRYVPGSQTGLQPGAGAPGVGVGAPGAPGAPGAADQAEQREQLREETGLQIVDIENLNAIFVQYENIEDLREVEFWVRTLDIPTLQVSIEIKFVEVITNKAKQLMPEFVISDLTEGFTLDESVLRTRFAQDRDQFTSVFDPLIESTGSANLLKGTTVFNYILNNGNSPISFTLRVLEAQGVINVVNGPTITVLNSETAEFEIRRDFGLRQPLEGATGQQQDQLTLVPSIRPVFMTVEPIVTRAGNITLDIDVEMEDFDQHLGAVVNLDPESLSALAPAATTPRAMAKATEFGVLFKQLTTKARIPDGGTVVLGGWRNERTVDLESGIPILRDIPFIGKLFFERMQKDEDKITLLIFLTGQVLRD